MPPEKDQRKTSGGIRVVEDSEQEEVVRLDAPEVGPLARKDPSKEAMALPTMMGDADADDMPVFIGPENEWLVAAEAKEVTSVPMGWFVLLFLGLGGMLLWAFLQDGEVDESVDARSLNDSLIDDDAYAQVAGSFLQDRQEVSVEAAAKDYENMEDVLRGFLGAKTIEERVKYVRHPERVKPLMNDHYGRNEFHSHVYEKAKEYHIVPLDSWPFVALSALVEGGESLSILLENTPEGYLVDWESFVVYQPMSLTEFIEKRPTEGIDLRVYGAYDNFYANEFTEDQGYLCVELSERESDQTIFGYVKKGTPVASEMKKHLAAPPGRRKKQPFILRVKFLPDSKAPRSVLIEKIVSALWAYPTNPDVK